MSSRFTGALPAVTITSTLSRMNSQRLRRHVHGAPAPPKFDCDRAALDPTQLAQPLSKSSIACVLLVLTTSARPHFARVGRGVPARAVHGEFVNFHKTKRRGR